jgi:antitoxin YefM
VKRVKIGFLINEGVYAMYTIYQLKANELDEKFLVALKAMFKDKEIEIAVYERDETAYLLRSPANRERLLNAVREVEQTRNIITPEQEQFQ